MPATRTATGKTTTGDSKQGLIITLICFVVLSIILAVMAYMWYSDGATQVAKAKDAENKQKNAEKDREWWKFQALALKDYAGHLQNKKEREDLDKLRGDFDQGSLSGDGKEEVKNLVTTLNQRLGWDQNQKKPLKTYSQMVEDLNQDLSDTRKKLAQAQDDVQKTRDEEKTMEEQKDAEVKRWKGEFDRSQKENVAIKRQMEDEFQKLLAEFGDMSKQMAELRKKSDTDVQAKELAVKRLQNQIRTMDLKVKKLIEVQRPPDLTKFENPKGKIVQLDTRNNMAWINLGSADNLRPQQNVTFSVFGSGAGGRPHDRKGSVAVTDVRGPHLSVAKITEVVDPRENPLMTGDLLVNPAWSPDARQHVAIAGLIDLTGDGRDSIGEFMRLLQQQGVVVDAYLDLKTLTIKGQMDVNTNYLILGEQPKVETRQQLNPDDPTFQRKSEVYDKVGAMQEEARKLGVTIVPLQRFVQLTGYQIPRGARTSEGYSFDRPTISSSGGGERQTPTSVKRQKDKPKAKPAQKDKEDTEGDDNKDKKDDNDK